HVTVPTGVEHFIIDPIARASGASGVLARVARIRRLRAFIRARRPDVVVAFVDYTNLYTLIATRGLGVPVVVSERVDPRDHRIAYWQRVLRRVLYPRAAGVVVQTRRTAEWARSVVS